MAFHTVTPAELGREKEFGYFTQEAPCSFSFSTELDVTALYAHAKAANVRFFPCFLHCLTAEVNARREFRMAERAEELEETAVPETAAFDGGSEIVGGYEGDPEAQASENGDAGSTVQEESEGNVSETEIIGGGYEGE